MLQTKSNTMPSRLPHRLAVVLVCAVFPLIWVGGLVTSSKAGMAVPDWPTTFGYNMFLYPWESWIRFWDVFIEHSHRLLGAAAGFLTIALAWSLWNKDDRRWMRWLGAAALAAVIGQGVLGGLRVMLDARLLAMTHACTGPLYFALCVAIMHFTSKEESVATADVGTAKTFRLALLTTCLAYLQLVLGAVVRHMPVYAPPSTFRAAVLFHLFLAAVLTVHIVLLVDACRRSASLRRVGWFLALLIIVQLSLGAGTWVVNFGFPQWVNQIATTPNFVIRTNSLPQLLVTTAHVAVGSLIIVTSLVLTLRARRFVPVSTTVAAVSAGLLMTETISAEGLR